MLWVPSQTCREGSNLLGKVQIKNKQTPVFSIGYQTLIHSLRCSGWLFLLSCLANLLQIPLSHTSFLKKCALTCIVRRPKCPSIFLNTASNWCCISGKPSPCTSGNLWVPRMRRNVAYHYSNWTDWLSRATHADNHVSCIYLILLRSSEVQHNKHATCLQFFIVGFPSLPGWALWSWSPNKS